MYPFIAKVEYWDDFEEPETLRHINILLYAEDMAAAVGQVEHGDYVDKIESIQIIAAGDNGQFFEVPDHIAKIFSAGCGIYKEGLLNVQRAFIRDELHDDAEVIHRTLNKEG